MHQIIYKRKKLCYYYGSIKIKTGGTNMATKRGDYFGLSYIVSVILAIIPVTAWICGALTRFSEGKIVAGLIRLIFGFNIVWLLDLILMIVSKHILRILPV